MRRDLVELLCGNPYPGRGIVIGCSGDGKRIVIVYFIMGRSENSRNRIFVKTDDGVRTAAFDPSKMTDPSLIIYHPVRRVGTKTIVTNGDQTETIFSHLSNGLDFRVALQTREFEPDHPVYTPRISGLVEPGSGYKLSIIKTMSGDPGRCQRNYFEYADMLQGVGHFISTYETDGDPPPSFTGEPIPVTISYSGSLDDFSLDVWNTLDDANKVSLYAMECDLYGGDMKDLIINKHIPGGEDK